MAMAPHEHEQIAQITAWREELRALHERIAPRFRRPAVRARAGKFLAGLLDPVERRNGWQLAEASGDATPDRMQRLLNHADWSAARARDRLLEFARERFGDPEGIGVLDETSFPKNGDQSVGVQRQYCGALGKVANCQVGVSVHAATDQASCPINWRLFLPQDWDHDAERRRAAHVPAEQRHRPKWQLALDMLDELAAWGLAPPVLLADAAYGEVNQFRLGLEQRALAYVVQVPATISAYAQDVAPETLPYAGRG